MSESPIAGLGRQWLHPDQIISEREAAQLRGVSLDTFRRQQRRGDMRIPRFQISLRRIGYRLSDVLQVKEAR